MRPGHAEPHEGRGGGMGAGATQDRGKHFHKVRDSPHEAVGHGQAGKQEEEGTERGVGNTTGKYSERRDKSFARGWTPLASWSRTDSTGMGPLDRLAAALRRHRHSFELGFLETNIDTTEGITLFAVNRFVDLVFTIDILVQMNTMYFDPKGRKVYSRKRIRAPRQTWLFVDVISILPFELILSSLTNTVDQSQARLKAIHSSAFCVS